MSKPDLFITTTRWSAAYPAAYAGVLVMRGAANAADHPGLEARKATLEQRLRARYAGRDRAGLLQEPVL